MSLDTILSRIASREPVPSSELLPYLCSEAREQRANVNRLLAEACWRSGGEEQLQQARTFVSRAWVVSGFSAELIPLFVKIHAALGDVETIRDAYKRLGMIKAAQGDPSEAIRYFNLWQYGYQAFQSLDRYAYDFDILDCVDRLAAPDRFSPRPRPERSTGGKIRVAYLAAGVKESGSSIMKVIAVLARHHDRSRFEPIVFVPETERMVKSSAAGRGHLELFRNCGCELVTAPDIRPAHARLLALAGMIHDSHPDLLITSAALSTFDHCFVTSLRPAPVVIGLIQGPPQQFAPLTLDWGISWTMHPLQDCPMNCALTRLEGGLPARSDITPYDRGALDIPPDAVVILSAGRHVKFQDSAVWQAIVRLITDHPNAYFLALGVTEAEVPFLASLLTPEIGPRIRLLGWRGDDYLRILCMADIVLDTFPSGGGLVLTDAMGLGIPVVAFKNDYLKPYDQVEWSPAEELINVQDVLLERGDFAGMRQLVSRLIEDRDYRREIARRCQEDIHQHRGDPVRAVQKYEAICLRILESGLARDGPRDGRSAEVSELTRRLDRPRVPRWVAASAALVKRALRFGERLLDRVTEA